MTGESLARPLTWTGTKTIESLGRLLLLGGCDLYCLIITVGNFGVLSTIIVP